MKIKIRQDSRLREYAKQYSYAFRMIYANYENMNKDLQNKILTINNLLDVATYDIIVCEVKNKKTKDEANIKTKQELILQYTKELEVEIDQRKIFWLDKKRNKLIGTIGKGIVFGGKVNLQNYVRAINKGNEELAEKYYQLYQEQRILPYYFIGRANEKGNRKFNFNLNNNEIIFKPKVRQHFTLQLLPNKNQVKELNRLQQAIDRKEIAVTVSLKEDFIVLTYDNEKLAGFAFDAVGYQRAKRELQEVKNYKNLSDEQKKELSPEFIALKRNYFEEQKSRQLVNKNQDVVAAIDMNPEHIGLTIRNTEIILFTKCFNLSDLLAETVGNNTEEIRYNLGNIYKQILGTLNHYKVSYFFTEELEFKHDESMARRANRKNQNLWCREFQCQLIRKHCQNLGIIHREINAAYSSYVGNMLYNFFDSVAASAELARRGLILLKKISEKWYPDQKDFPLDNLQERQRSGYVPILDRWDEQQMNSFKLLSVQSGFTFLTSRKQVGSQPVRYRRLSKPEHKTNFIKTETFSGQLENVLND